MLRTSTTRPALSPEPFRCSEKRLITCGRWKVNPHVHEVLAQMLGEITLERDQTQRGHTDAGGSGTTHQASLRCEPVTTIVSFSCATTWLSFKERAVRCMHCWCTQVPCGGILSNLAPGELNTAYASTRLFMRKRESDNTRDKVDQDWKS